MTKTSQAGKLAPAWMVEIGYGFARTAQLAGGQGYLGLQSEINAALAVEILLKSLQSNPVENGLHGSVMTNFSGPYGHDLFELYKSVSDEIKKRIGLHDHEDTFLRKRDTFLKKRYDYEAHGGDRGFDTSLLYASACMIPKIVDYFVEQGSQDPWFQLYQSDRERFRLRNGISPML